MIILEEVYRLSAGTLLYAVRKLHKRGFYGLPDVMPRLSDGEFPAFAQEAEMELIEAGLGLLDFDGEFTLDRGFAELLGACADCKSVMGVSVRRDRTWIKRTLYLTAGAVLEREEDLICTLRRETRFMDVLLEVLALPEKLSYDSGSSGLSEILVDTDVLEQRDLQKLQAAGCGEAQARMILAALDGDGGYAHISRVDDKERTGELLLMYGGEGILSAGAEYSETQELLRLKPLRKEKLLQELRIMQSGREEYHGGR